MAILKEEAVVITFSYAAKNVDTISVVSDEVLRSVEEVLSSLVGDHVVVEVTKVDQ